MALLLPTVVYGAVGFERLLRYRKSLAGLAAAAMMVATIIELPDKIDRNDHFSDVYRAEQTAIDTVVDAKAVVILPITADGAYVLHPRGWLTNDLSLANEVLYAADRGAANIELSRRFPDRRIYRLQAIEATRSPLTFRPSVRELVAVSAPTLSRTITSPIPAGATRVQAYVQTTADNRQTCDITAQGATARVNVLARPEGVELSGCAAGALKLAALVSPATLIVGFDFTAPSPKQSEQRELRVWTSTDGANVVTLNEETWRILPHDKTSTRVIEANPDLVVTA
jgi:hypothetical protein